MKTYNVGISFEEGVVVTVKADNITAAVALAGHLAFHYGGTDYPEEYEPIHVHRDWFTQNVEEVKDEQI
jgi:hypothetical protein